MGLSGIVFDGIKFGLSSHARGQGMKDKWAYEALGSYLVKEKWLYTLAVILI